jgi:5-methylcytosine-specific restriction protein B
MSKYENEFREYLRRTPSGQGNTLEENQINYMIRDLNIGFIEILKSELEVDSLLDIDDTSILTGIKNRCTNNGDLQDFNTRNGNGRPSRALYQYINFLNEQEKKPVYWLIPNNPEVYNAIKAFEELNEIDWGNAQNNKINLGDIVYIYSSKPIQAITVKAEVTKTYYDQNELLNNDQEYGNFDNFEKPKTYFRLKLLSFTNRELLSLENLQLNGLSGKIQGKRTITSKLLEYILKNENKMEQIMKNQIKILTQLHPLNQILYGPPGTGKTYNTINKALEIIDGNIPSTRAEAKKRFDELRDDGQIVFTTFHQSFGYEEFVEGIKAIPIGKEGNEDGDEMIYAIVDGIFKKLSKKSLENYAQKSVTTTLNKKKFILNAKSLNIQAEMIEDDASIYRVLKGSKIRKGQAPSFDRYNYIVLKNNVLQQAKLKEENEFYILEEDYVFQSMSAASSVILGRQSNGYNDWKEIVPDLVSDDAIKQAENKNHILIIDEINRGNISKIFGELITLIEPSKRLGAEEEIQLKLPYSNDLFGVPSNLYIIGTMNTADRSIAQIDTALRRRFEFVEMMPDYGTLDGLNDVEGINVPEMLRAINERICYLYDREHQIGHSYFMSLKNEPTKAKLDEIFRVNIIPLLAEYFYGDWGDIRIILNNDFVKEKGEAKFKIEASRKKKNVIFEVNSELKTEQYAKIYETNNN